MLIAPNATNDVQPLTALSIEAPDLLVVVVFAEADVELAPAPVGVIYDAIATVSSVTRHQAKWTKRREQYTYVC
jgi:hypothetical protein